eukprot:TRINITY_DN5316_c0_g1_i1.p1 TRINITY_DN5316_c0_g1~~TRINITY_DN5316_c0_g1_i1.p1  ORF type:complete len:203 (-),score=85.45 TRINITY_DN5316_c0_g1_i1:31-639(-)
MDNRNLPHSVRIPSDVGFGFSLGFIGSSCYFFAKNALLVPWRGKIKMALREVARKSPTVGGNFAAFSFFFTGSDALLSKYRQTEGDPYNVVAAGAISGAIMALRGGLWQAGKGGLVGGIFLGLIETVVFFMQEKPAGQPDPYQQIQMVQNQANLQQAAAAAQQTTGRMLLQQQGALSRFGAADVPKSRWDNDDDDDDYDEEE